MPARCPPVAAQARCAGTRVFLGCMGRPAVFVSMALLLTALGAAGHAQERRVICVLVDDLGFGASDQENGAKFWAILRDEVVQDRICPVRRNRFCRNIRSTNPPAAAASSTRWNSSAPPLQDSRPSDPIKSWGAIRVSLGTASDVVGSLARLQNRDKQLLLLTSRSSVNGSFGASFARNGEAAPPDVTDDVAAVVAVAKAGNVTLRVVSTADPQSAALLRALR